MNLADRPDPVPAEQSIPRFHGRVWDVVTETFDLPGVGRLSRDLVRHPGAVAVLALDEDDQVLLLQQYRHPIAAHDWELPAGLLDVPGESELGAARRELAEETDLRAARWHRLVGLHSSPGALSEHITIFLARQLDDIPPTERHERTDEEATMVRRWVGLDEVVQGVLDGRLENGILALGCLAAARLRDAGWQGLGPAL